jgi:hypothetical protein
MDSGAPPSKETVTQGIDVRTDAQKETDKQNKEKEDEKSQTPTLSVPQGEPSILGEAHNEGVWS